MGLHELNDTIQSGEGGEVSLVDTQALPPPLCLMCIRAFFLHEIYV